MIQHLRAERIFMGFVIRMFFARQAKLPSCGVSRFIQGDIWRSCGIARRSRINIVPGEKQEKALSP
jgi:hypothetical protein